MPGPAFAQSTEFDNYDGVRHNPDGNLLALNFGTTAGGGSLYVYASQAECQGNPGHELFKWDGITGGNLSRVGGLSVSPDNTKIAVYGYDTYTIYVLNYTTGVDVGLGGPIAATVSFNTNIDLSAIVSSNHTLGTAWLDDNTLLWVDQSGNLYTVTLGGVVTLRRPNPGATATAISMADVEYNPEISSNVAVSIGNFDAGVTANSVYFVNPTGMWPIVNQSGGVPFTTHNAAGTGTFREIAWDNAGNLFIGTFVDNANLINLRYITDAGGNPAGVVSDGNVVWNTQDAGQTTTNFSGMDVALGVEACALPGDLDLSGAVDADDVQPFVDCYISAIGANCVCADLAAPFGVLDSADHAAFVTLLLN